MMREINRTTGTTFVLVTHDPDVAAACDRIILMRDGVVVGEQVAAASQSHEAEGGHAAAPVVGLGSVPALSPA